ncbi:MAG: methyltransferase [Oscillospiraceae bacterium]|jgi:uroporphyrinogen decarboxylase|nr:methyltransferase [Oscillospiraceae bacterium]
MSNKQAALDVIHRRSTGAGVFWSGRPAHDTIPLYAKEWGIAPTAEAIYETLQDDCRYIPIGGYRHPEGLAEWNPGWGMERNRSLGAAGCFAEAETMAELGNYPWPDAAYYDFSETYAAIARQSDKLVFSGPWCTLLTTLTNHFGMQNYFMMLYDNPALIEAVTERFTDYYVSVIHKFYSGAPTGEVLFIGIDLGTQRDLFLSAEQFRRFLLPSIRRLIAAGKQCGKQVMMHSCGSIYRIIPDLIDAGVDILHPLQAQAAGMAAAELAQYKNDIAFCGGIDAQSFIVNATPAQVADEVQRVYGLLGPNIIISPSHEEVLPNVPAANMLAMASAAKALR